jgi:diguanylate cyclase (GGDEF)-like protein
VSSERRDSAPSARPASRESDRRQAQPAVDISGVDDRLIDVVAADAEGTDDDTRLIMKRRAEMGATFFSSLLAALVGIQRPEKEAEKLWESLLKHKFEMSKQLGRNVGIRVAAYDYFTNITSELSSSARLVDSQVLVDTALLAVTDGLTNLYNHRYFHDRLSNELDRAAEEGTPVAVILADIDHFKDYNDINGHVAGDVALHEVAQVIRGAAEGGVAARYGGEEFGIILPRCGKSRAGAVAERLRRSVEGHAFANEFVLPGGRLTLSAGVAEFPLDATRRRALVDYADRALYESKRQGRNRVSIFAPNRRTDPRRIVRLAVELRPRAPAEADLPERLAAMTVDLSGGGLLCEVDRPLPTALPLEVRLPEAVGPLAAPVAAVTLRRQPAGVNLWHVALRFEDLTPATREALCAFAEAGL